MTPSAGVKAHRSNEAAQAVNEARSAMQRGDRHAARRAAERAVALDPKSEEGWLILASVSGPGATIPYLQRALEINPGSERALQGIDWARGHQLSHTASPTSQAKPAPEVNLDFSSGDALADTRPIPRPKAKPAGGRAFRWLWAPTALIGCVVLVALLAWYGSTAFALPAPEVRQAGAMPVSELVKPSHTPTKTPTPTRTPTPTNTPTPTPTPTVTPTPEATDTPAPLPTPAPYVPSMPLENPPDAHWVDVDLTHQTAYAYDGKNLVRSFVVSTGTWLHPTVTGQFYIYVKYRYADMTGPGYYLPNVPYVMYFYKDYGLHGTYWHHNFGTPMSHGCVNFTIDDAGWLFDFSDIGTLVNIHD